MQLARHVDDILSLLMLARHLETLWMIVPVGGSAINLDGLCDFNIYCLS